MAHNPITLDLLRTLDAIDQKGSFAAAADALHKVPSALTYTIQKVEQDLELKLFDRSGHRAKLTPSGQLILEEGRLILRDIESLAASAKKIASGWEPILTISVDSVFENERLFPLVKEFNHLHPYVKVRLQHDSLSGTWEKLLNQQADLVISSKGLAPKVEGYNTKSVGEFQMQFVVAKDHPLASISCEVTEKMIEPYTVIVVSDTSRLMTPKTVGWTKHSQSIVVASMGAKIRAQVDGLGVGFLPSHRIQQELADGLLIPLNMPTSVDTAVTAWRKGTQGPALEWFVERINSGVLGLG